MLRPGEEEKLIRFATRLVNPQNGRVVIKPDGRGRGYWFGSGNLAEGPGGEIYLTGRYRHPGDSTTGLAKGERGFELALFRSQDEGRTFQKILSFSKEDLSFSPHRVLSIEGSALHITRQGVELFVSSEKANLSYPHPFEGYQKPGTGVWTIDRIAAPEIMGLKSQKPEILFSSRDPQFLHMKDPVAYSPMSGNTILVFCTHPFSWTSSNSAYAVRPSGGFSFSEPVYDFFPRGAAWDVAVSRISDILPLPELRKDSPSSAVSLIFYDGAECLRRHEQSASGVERPRGYSCEELGGMAVMQNQDLTGIERVSKHLPLFVSPWGTGACRYVHTLRTKKGIFATWQQSRKDESQPLVMNFLPGDEVHEILSTTE